MLGTETIRATAARGPKLGQLYSLCTAPFLWHSLALLNFLALYLTENSTEWASCLVKEGKRVNQPGFVSRAFHVIQHFSLYFLLPNTSKPLCGAGWYIKGAVSDNLGIRLINHMLLHSIACC